MLKFYSRYSHIFLFLPGLVVLCMGMFSLHTTVKMGAEHNELNQHYNALSTHYPDFENTPIVRRIKAQELDIQTHNRLLYWSVIAITLTGFLLLIIHADHLQKLVKINKEKQQDLKLLRQRLGAIEASFEGIAIVDAHGNLTYMNKALQDVYGVTQDQKTNFIGQSWLSLYTQENQEYINEYVMPIFEREGFWHDTTKILRLDGKSITAHVSMTRLEDGGFVGTARDITDSEKINAEKKEMEHHLAQAQKMEAIGRLAGGIAHDFNNILAAINGYAEFLSEDLPEESPQKKFADNILKAGFQARSLIDQILAFSRREDRKIEQIDLCVPLSESISMLKATLPKTIELHNNIELRTAPIEGNATQLAQTIMNLCVNARDAMNDDEGNIYIDLVPLDIEQDVSMHCIADDLADNQNMPLVRIEDGEAGQTFLYMGTVSNKHDYVRLSIRDTGTGMSRIVMQHIFEPFFTTKDINKGTGLGLASVHGTMAAHRGAMFIESVVGQGTKFDLLFPLSTLKEEEFVEAPTAILRTGGATILLVEDEPDVCEMTTMMLQRLGYEVETAENGLEALDMLREAPGHYDLVLTDQNMPKMTGVELIREAVLDFPNLPFVILSGYSEEKLIDVMSEQPAIKDVLRKPISQTALGETLASILSRKMQTTDKSAVNA